MDNVVADPVAEAEVPVETAPVEEAVETPETPAPTPDALARMEQTVKEIKDKMNAPKDAPSPEQIRLAVREKIKAETGMTDKQLDFMDNRIVQIVAPLQAKTVYNEWKDSKGADLTPEIEKNVKEYLSKYPEQHQGDPVLLDNIFYMELGKATAAARKKNPAAPATPAAPSSTSPVIGRRIVPTPPPAASLTGGGAPKTGASTLTKEELAVAAKMRMTPEEYAAAKGDPTIGRFRKK